jgi:hypothetical protein
MNNSFARLIDGMNATLRSEVLSRLDDEFARGQVFGIINVLNTFKARADWSAGFLLQQIGAQRSAFDAVRALLQASPHADSSPVLPAGNAPAAVPIADLLALRDEGNRAIAEMLSWVDGRRASLTDATLNQLENVLRDAMRTEVSVELKNSPRPLFAEMSSGKED